MSGQGFVVLRSGRCTTMYQRVREMSCAKCQCARCPGDL
jgi:hypothetical protein